MTIQQAAESMRESARKMRAWSRCLAPSMAADEAHAFYQVLTREAERLEADANEADPSAVPVAA